MQQELLTLPGHLSYTPLFSGVRVTRSLVLCICFVDRCLSFCTFSFGHCVVCSSSIYGFWLPLWYLQTRLVHIGRRQTWFIFFARSRKYNILLGLVTLFKTSGIFIISSPDTYLLIKLVKYCHGIRQDVLFNTGVDSKCHIPIWN